MLLYSSAQKEAPRFMESRGFLRKNPQPRFFAKKRQEINGKVLRGPVCARRVFPRMGEPAEGVGNMPGTPAGAVVSCGMNKPSMAAVTGSAEASAERSCRMIKHRRFPPAAT